jgi:hypothetical protein
MAAPNLLALNTINGKTTGANLTSNTAITVLNNPAGSGKVLKVNTVNVANYVSNSATITIVWNNGAGLSGTSYPIINSGVVPPASTLNVLDKTSQYYLEENTSLGAISTTANALIVTCSYEDIS